MSVFCNKKVLFFVTIFFFQHKDLFSVESGVAVAVEKPAVVVATPGQTNTSVGSVGKTEEKEETAKGDLGGRRGEANVSSAIAKVLTKEQIAYFSTLTSLEAKRNYLQKKIEEKKKNEEDFKRRGEQAPAQQTKPIEKPAVVLEQKKPETVQQSPQTKKEDVAQQVAAAKAQELLRKFEARKNESLAAIEQAKNNLAALQEAAGAQTVNTALQSQISAAVENIKQLQARQEKIDGILAQKDSVNQAVAILKSEQATLAQKDSLLGQQLQAAKQDVGNINSQINALKNDLSKMAEADALTKNEIGNLTKDAKSLLEDKKNLEAKAKLLAEELKNLNQELNEKLEVEDVAQVSDDPIPSPEPYVPSPAPKIDPPQPEPVLVVETPPKIDPLPSFVPPKIGLFILPTEPELEVFADFIPKNVPNLPNRPTAPNPVSAPARQSRIGKQKPSEPVFSQAFPILELILPAQNKYVLNSEEFILELPDDSVLQEPVYTLNKKTNLIVLDADKESLPTVDFDLNSKSPREALLAQPPDPAPSPAYTDLSVDDFNKPVLDNFSIDRVLSKIDDGDLFHDRAQKPELKITGTSEKAPDLSEEDLHQAPSLAAEITLAKYFVHICKAHYELQKKLCAMRPTKIMAMPTKSITLSNFPNYLRAGLGTILWLEGNLFEKDANKNTFKFQWISLLENTGGDQINWKELLEVTFGLGYFAMRNYKDMMKFSNDSGSKGKSFSTRLPNPSDDNAFVSRPNKEQSTQIAITDSRHKIWQSYKTWLDEKNDSGAYVLWKNYRALEPSYKDLNFKDEKALVLWLDKNINKLILAGVFYPEIIRSLTKGYDSTYFPTIGSTAIETVVNNIISMYKSMYSYDSAAFEEVLKTIFSEFTILSGTVSSFQYAFDPKAFFKSFFLPKFKTLARIIRQNIAAPGISEKIQNATTDIVHPSRQSSDDYKIADPIIDSQYYTEPNGLRLRTTTNFSLLPSSREESFIPKTIHSLDLIQTKKAIEALGVLTNPSDPSSIQKMSIHHIGETLIRLLEEIGEFKTKKGLTDQITGLIENSKVSSFNYVNEGLSKADIELCTIDFGLIGNAFTEFATKESTSEKDLLVYRKLDDIVKLVESIPDELKKNVSARKSQYLMISRNLLDQIESKFKSCGANLISIQAKDKSDTTKSLQEYSQKLQSMVELSLKKYNDALTNKSLEDSCLVISNISLQNLLDSLLSLEAVFQKNITTIQEYESLLMDRETAFTKRKKDYISECLALIDKIRGVQSSLKTELNKISGLSSDQDLQPLKQSFEEISTLINDVDSNNIKIDKASTILQQQSMQQLDLSTALMLPKRDDLERFFAQIQTQENLAKQHFAKLSNYLLVVKKARSEYRNDVLSLAKNNLVKLTNQEASLQSELSSLKSVIDNIPDGLRSSTQQDSKQLILLDYVDLENKEKVVKKTIAELTKSINEQPLTNDFANSYSSYINDFFDVLKTNKSKINDIIQEHSARQKILADINDKNLAIKKQIEPVAINILRLKEDLLSLQKKLNKEIKLSSGNSRWTNFIENFVSDVKTSISDVEARRVDEASKITIFLNRVKTSVQNIENLLSDVITKLNLEAGGIEEIKNQVQSIYQKLEKCFQEFDLALKNRTGLAVSSEIVDAVKMCKAKNKSGNSARGLKIESSIGVDGDKNTIFETVIAQFGDAKKLFTQFNSASADQQFVIGNAILSSTGFPVVINNLLIMANSYDEFYKAVADYNDSKGQAQKKFLEYQRKMREYEEGLSDDSRQNILEDEASVMVDIKNQFEKEKFDIQSKEYERKLEQIKNIKESNEKGLEDIKNKRIAANAKYKTEKLAYEKALNSLEIKKKLFDIVFELKSPESLLKENPSLRNDTSFISAKSDLIELQALSDACVEGSLVVADLKLLKIHLKMKPLVTNLLTFYKNNSFSDQQNIAQNYLKQLATLVGDFQARARDIADYKLKLQENESQTRNSLLKNEASEMQRINWQQNEELRQLKYKEALKKYNEEEAIRKQKHDEKMRLKQQKALTENALREKQKLVNQQAAEFKKIQDYSKKQLEITKKIIAKKKEIEEVGKQIKNIESVVEEKIKQIKSLKTKLAESASNQEDIKAQIDDLTKNKNDLVDQINHLKEQQEQNSKLINDNSKKLSDSQKKLDAIQKVEALSKKNMNDLNAATNSLQRLKQQEKEELDKTESLNRALSEKIRKAEKDLTEKQDGLKKVESLEQKAKGLLGKS